MTKRSWKIFGDENDFAFWSNLLLNELTVEFEIGMHRHKNPPEKKIFQNYDYDCGYGMFCTGMLMLGREDVLKTDLYTRLKVNEIDGTKSENIKLVLHEEGVSFLEMEGSRIEDLQKLVSDNGFAFVSYQSDCDLEKVGELEYGHYSIVFDVDGEFVWLIDPSDDVEWEPGFGKGVVRITRGEFAKRWIDKGVDGTIYESWLIALRGKSLNYEQ